MNDRKDKTEVQEKSAQSVPQRIHSESVGDVWAALTGQDPRAIMPQVAGTVIAAGGTRPVWQWKRDGKEYMVLAWPQDQPIRAALLLQTDENGKQTPVSVFPLLEGVPNDLLVEDVHPRQEGHGADVAVEMMAGKNPMWFFDPFYGRDRDDLTPGVLHTFWLAGAALGLRRALLDHFTIAQGAYYEEYAQKWLEDNPGKKTGDVPPLRVEIKDKHMILPGRHYGEYHMRGVVTEVEDWQFDKMPVKALYINFPFDERPPLSLPIFASSFVLGEYAPEKGQEVEAYVWLQGRIIDLDTEMPKTES